MTAMLAAPRYKHMQDRAGAGAARERKEGLAKAKAEVQPYVEYGKTAMERQNRLFADPSYLQETGGYKFTMDQGLKGTTAARSRSSIFSGETLKALTEYSAGLASQEYEKEWQRFQQGIDTGLGASTTAAEIEAGIGEAGARQFDQRAAWAAGYEGFHRQISGQWSGEFAKISAQATASCWVAEVLYGKYANKTLTTRAFVKKHMQDKTPLGAFCRMYSKYGKTWANWVKKSKMLRALAKPIWDRLYKMAIKELV